MPPTTWEHALWALCDVPDSCHSPGPLTVQDTVPEAGKPSARRIIARSINVWKVTCSQHVSDRVFAGSWEWWHSACSPCPFTQETDAPQTIHWASCSSYVCGFFFFSLQRAMISKFLPHPSLTPSLGLKVNGLLSITSWFLSVLSENSST